jgi:hypothetical protein
MLYATLAPFLADLIGSLALDDADPLFKAVYRDQKRPFVSPTVKAEIVLKVTSSRETLTNERYTQTPGPVVTLSSKMHGIREFTLNVQAKSYDLTYARWAHEYLERIRTRIQKRSVKDLMVAQNLACYGRGAIQDVEGKEDGQALSVANLDLFMRAGFEDGVGDPGLDWIETISLTSHVANEAGAEYAREAGNWTDVTMPAP